MRDLIRKGEKIMTETGKKIIEKIGAVMDKVEKKYDAGRLSSDSALLILDMCGKMLHLSKKIERKLGE